jgi:hypothetical protein
MMKTGFLSILLCTRGINSTLGVRVDEGVAEDQLTPILNAEKVIAKSKDMVMRPISHSQG